MSKKKRWAQNFPASLVLRWIIDFSPTGVTDITFTKQETCIIKWRKISVKITLSHFRWMVMGGKVFPLSKTKKRASFFLHFSKHQTGLVNPQTLQHSHTHTLISKGEGEKNLPPSKYAMKSFIKIPPEIQFLLNHRAPGQNLVLGHWCHVPVSPVARREKKRVHILEDKFVYTFDHHFPITFMYPESPEG